MAKKILEFTVLNWKPVTKCGCIGVKVFSIGIAIVLALGAIRLPNESNARPNQLADAYGTEALAEQPSAADFFPATVNRKSAARKINRQLRRTRRQWISTGVKGAIVSGLAYLPIPLFAQANVNALDERFQAQLDYFLSQATIQPLSNMETIGYWLQEGFSPADAQKGVAWYKTFKATIAKRLTDMGTSINDIDEPMLVRLYKWHLQGQFAVQALRQSPDEKRLVAFLTSMLPLLAQEYRFWRVDRNPPHEMFLLKIASEATALLPKNESAVGRAFVALVQQLSPNVLRRETNIIDKLQTDLVREAYARDLLIYVDFGQFEFNLYRRIVFRSPFIFDFGPQQTVLVEYFEELMSAHPLYGFVTKLPDGRSLVVYAGSADHDAQTAIQMRDGELDMGAGVRRIMEYEWKGATEESMKPIIEWGTIAHETGHAWRNFVPVMEVANPDFMSRIGIRNEPAMSGISGRFKPIDWGRFGNELTGYLWQMAYSPKPLYEFYEILYNLEPQFHERAEAKVADWIARGMILALADKLGGSVKAEGLELLAQEEFLQRQKVLDWLQGVMKAEPNPDKLHDLMREAAKWIFSQSYYTPDARPAEMPKELVPRKLVGSQKPLSTRQEWFAMITGHINIRTPLPPTRPALRAGA